MCQVHGLSYKKSRTFPEIVSRQMFSISSR